MRIQVKVIPRAKKPGVERLPDGTWKVKLTQPAEGGRANAALIDLLAKQFNKPKQSIQILQGTASRMKVVEIC